MFLKQRILKQLLKSGYKDNGLTVGHYLSDDKKTEAYYIASGYWAVWFNTEFFTKEIKAAVIELCGDLPEVNEVFKAYKDSGNQYEIEQPSVYFLPEKFKKLNVPLRITNTIIKAGGRNNRLLQDEYNTKHIKVIDDTFIDIIDLKSIDYDNGEYEPVGPMSDDTYNSIIMWGNNACYLMVCNFVILNPEIKDYLEHLKNIIIF